jgi:TatD DNase family protein
MFELVDTHCHIQSLGVPRVGEANTRELWSKAESLTAESVITEAVEAGVTRMICVGCDLDDSKLAIDFVKDQSSCWASIGIHPHSADDYIGKDILLAGFSELATSPKVVAIGECGLDYYYNHSDQKAQETILRFQIELALKNNLPIIFHVRDAFDDFWLIFDSYSGIRGVLHSYTDNQENLNKATQRGLYIGVNGIATFAKDSTQLEVYKSIPLENLVFETDSPFLTPTPYRGTINEPKRVVNITDFVADLRGLDREILSAVTTSNACQLFGI